MKALSFIQPWAFCVFAYGARSKRIDNRTVNTHHRGELLVHASLTGGRQGRMHWNRASQIVTDLGLEPLPVFESFQRGGIIGRTQVLDVIPPNDWPVAQHLAAKHDLDLGWWFPDQYGYVLAPLGAGTEHFAELIPCAGARGMWNAPNAVLDKLPIKLTDKHMREQEGSLTDALSKAFGGPVEIVECSWRRP